MGWTATLHGGLCMGSISAGQSMRPGGWWRTGARSGLWSLLVSSPVSQCMLLLLGLPPSPALSPLLVPTGPSKADFPRRQASRGGLQPRTGGRQGRQEKAEEASEPASEPREGAGFRPVTEPKIVLPSHTGLEVHVAPTVHTPCSNKYRPPSH